MEPFWSPFGAYWALFGRLYPCFPGCLGPWQCARWRSRSPNATLPRQPCRLYFGRCLDSKPVLSVVSEWLAVSACLCFSLVSYSVILLSRLASFDSQHTKQPQNVLKPNAYPCHSGPRTPLSHITCMKTWGRRDTPRSKEIAARGHKIMCTVERRQSISHCHNVTSGLFLLAPLSITFVSRILCSLEDCMLPCRLDPLFNKIGLSSFQFSQYSIFSVPGFVFLLLLPFLLFFSRSFRTSLSLFLIQFLFCHDASFSILLSFSNSL